MSARTQKWADLVARGCTCGGEDYTPCPLHIGGSDNRGIRAWFEAGMPLGFPSVATCAVCGTEGLMYPDVNLDDKTKPFVHTPTLICPRCSVPASERRLRAEAEASGYVLNDKAVFGVAVAA